MTMTGPAILALQMFERLLQRGYSIDLITIDIDVEVDVDLGGCFGSLKGGSKSV